MDKNVSGVDLDELMKAREELDKERGIETDPNLYSDYNPNRGVVEQENAITEENASNNPTSDIMSQEDNFTKEPNQAESNQREDNVDLNNDENVASSESNLSKFNAFAAFEVKENAPQQPETSDVQQTTAQQNGEKSSSITLENAMTDEEIDKKLEDIDDADDLENLLSDILDVIEDDEETESVKESESETTISSDAVDNDIIVDNDQQETEEETVSQTPVAGIDIEPKFEDEQVTEAEADSNQENETNQMTAEDLSENIKEIKTDANPIINTSLDDFIPTEELKEGAEKEAEELVFEKKTNNSIFDDESKPADEQVEIKSDLDDIQGLFIKKPDEQTSNEVTKNKEDEVRETESEATLEENEDVVIEDTVAEEESQIQEKEQTQNEESDSDNEDNTSDTESEGDQMLAEEDVGDLFGIDEDEEETEEISDLDEGDIGRYIKSANDPLPSTKKNKQKSVYAENTINGADAEVITDYSQLRDILEKQFQESDVIDEDEFKKKNIYKAIDDFKFIDEIATNEFKTSDSFSYILGKNEKNETIYGNFKEHCNLGVFGKNDTVTNSMLNSLLLSLCLKNSYNDVNFVLLDSDINSSFEVYNKSSYLYFNRIAKTNKEILDTLIEVSKEVDNRYNQLAGLGVKNIDSYNEVAKENGLQTMPYVVLVFNNYTSASQATDHDKINACLYQILKYGRIAGFYAVVCAKSPIDINQVNYSLSSRLSFKSDDDSTYTVGAEGVENLPGENDAVYFNIATNKTEHIKVATVTDIELDLIIKDLEE